MHESTDALFALAPLMWLARRGNVEVSTKRWFLNGLFYWAATLSWMPAIIKNDGPWPLVLLGWVALAAYCALYFAAYGYLSALYWRRAEDRWHLRLVGVLLVEPVLWCGLELMRSRLFGGFAWNQLGVVPVNNNFGAPAALGGVYLCSAVMVLINGTIAGIAERMIAAAKRCPVSRWRSFETVAAFAVIWGVYLAAEWIPPPLQAEGTKGLKVALVQRNFPCCFKRGEREDAFVSYGKLTENATQLKPELVVLAESAMCEFGAVKSVSARRFAAWLGERCGGAAVLAGGSRADGEGRLYNSAALYSGQKVQVYDKNHLVPFGEYIPGDKLWPYLQRFAPVGSCTAGELKLLHLEKQDIALGVGICFEDTDSALMRRQAALGAQALVFITNDSWFSNSHEAWAHSWQATARAIETGLPVIRVGNSGVTGTITSDGKANWLEDSGGLPLVDVGAAMFDRVTIPAADRVNTPYVRFGDWPLAITFGLMLLLLAVFAAPKKQV